MIPRTIFAEEHHIFRAQCRSLFEKEFAPFHAQWEREGIVPHGVWKLMGDAGLLCTSVPEDHEGLGADKLTAVVMLEEFSDLGLTGMALNFAMHSEIVTPYLLKYGSPQQKAHWLPAMISGERIGALAMTEPVAGSDLQRMRTVARREGDGFRLNGQKTFISNGQHTNLTIVAAKTDPAEGAKGISLFLVEGERVGYSKGRNLEKIGLHSADTSELFFDDVRIPAENLIGDEGQGLRYLMQELPWERLQLAIVAVAACEAALRWTIDYCRERQAFGRSIASFQNTQFKLAELRTETQVARVFVDRCIGLSLDGKLDVETGAMAKYWTTDLQCKVVDECLQLHGGYGYMRDYAIGRAFVDARAQRIYGGTNEIMKEIISRTN
jgi:alkylation response protein AidB-like acyl-CoA dehydrogenase